MKNAIAILYALSWVLLISAPLTAAPGAPAHLRVVARKNGGGSTPWTQVIGSTNTAGSQVGDAATRTYAAGSFVAANSGTVDSVAVFLRENGTFDAGSDTIDVSIYTDSGGSPGSAIANGTIAAVSLNDLPNTLALHPFEFPTPPAITSGTTYWVVLKANTISATEFVSYRYESVGANAMKRATSPPTWSNLDPTADFYSTLEGASP